MTEKENKKILKKMLTFEIIHDTISKVRVRRTKQKAAVAQSVERRIGSAEVTGPIPVSSSEEYRRKHVNSRFTCFFCVFRTKNCEKIYRYF